MFDPRPELDTHPEWEYFLTLMANISDEMYGLFDFVRCNGALLLETEDSYKIQPLFGKECWTQAEWAAFRKEEMVPQRNEIDGCLKFGFFLCKLARGEKCELAIMSEYFQVQRSTPNKTETRPTG